MRVEAHIEIAAAREVVWRHVTNPRDWPGFMAGMTRCAAVPGERSEGLRARYDVLMLVGSAEVGGEIEIVEFDEPGDMAWVSVTGPSQRGRWRLRELTPDRTAVTLRLNYQAPGGALGLIADRVAAGAIKGNLKRSLAQVKRALDGTTEAETSVLRDVVNVVGRRLHLERVLAEAGLVAPARPDRIVRGLLALSRLGPSPPAAGYTSPSRCRSSARTRSV